MNIADMKLLEDKKIQLNELRVQISLRYQLELNKKISSARADFVRYFTEKGLHISGQEAEPIASYHDICFEFKLSKEKGRHDNVIISNPSKELTIVKILLKDYPSSSSTTRFAHTDQFKVIDEEIDTATKELDNDPPQLIYFSLSKKPPTTVTGKFVDYYDFLSKNYP